MSRDKNSRGDLHGVVREGFSEKVTYTIPFKGI